MAVEMVEMGSLPNDIVLDILSRLSVKTLAKFRCVSKQFCNLTSDPYFRDLHHRRSNSLSLFLSHSNDKDGTITLHLSSIDENGMLHNKFSKTVCKNHCFVYSLDHMICIWGINHIYMCNPSTQQFVTLFQKDSLSPFNKYCHRVGFGYLPSTNEYKVVRIFYRTRYPTYEMGCEVLTIADGGTGSCSWRTVENCPYQLGGVNSAFISGAVHWTIWWHGDGDIDDAGSLIVSFNLEEEKFRTIPRPQGLLGCGSGLGVLRECLCLLSYGREEKEIWMLKDYDNLIWVKEYRIDLKSLIDVDFSYVYLRTREMEDGENSIEIRPRGYFRGVKYVKNGLQLCSYRENFYSLGSGSR